MLKFTQEPLERLIFVCQTGGRNTKIKWVCTGLESFIFGSILYNRLPLTKKGVVYVFRHSDEKYLGYIIRGQYDIPEKHPEQDGSEFKDWYTSTYKDAYPEG